jgi:hypothetical protein
MSLTGMQECGNIDPKFVWTDEMQRELEAKQAKQRYLFDLMCKQTKDLTDAEMIELLEDRYMGDPIPPCHICGRKLTMVAAGGGRATIYACVGVEDGRYLPGRSVADDHYGDSRFTHLKPGDSTVLELIKRFKALPK